LGFSGDIAAKWDQFRRALIDSGAYIQDIEDELMWIGGDNSGYLTVKNIIWLYYPHRVCRELEGGDKQSGNGTYN
jgi:hypothetical protein